MVHRSTYPPATPSETVLLIVQAYRPTEVTRNQPVGGTSESHVFDVAGGDMFGWVGVAGDVPL